MKRVLEVVFIVLALLTALALMHAAEANPVPTRTPTTVHCGDICLGA